MTLVTFHATPDRKAWIHRPGGWKVKDDGNGGTYQILVEPVIMRDGDSLEMDDFDTAWALGMMPDNMTAD